MNLTESYLKRVIKEVADEYTRKKLSNSFASKASDRRKKIMAGSETKLHRLKKEGYLDYYDARVGYKNGDGKFVIKPSGNISSIAVDEFKGYMAKYHPEEKIRFLLIPRNDIDDLSSLKHFDIKIVYQK